MRDPIVFCLCGCGSRFRRLDIHGRPRRYASGHNPRDRSALESVFSAVARGLRTTLEIERSTGMSRVSVHAALSRLSRAGSIVRIERGKYAVKMVQGQ